MKRLALAAILMCCTVALMAQDSFQVKYYGAKPTISDFAWSYFAWVNSWEDECGDRPARAMEGAMELRRDEKPMEENVTLTVDERNGYIVYEWHDNGTEGYIFRLETCYWNESDGKHKIFAFNNMASYDNNGPIATETSGIDFFRYDNATKRMTQIAPPGFEIDYSKTYSLPRTGKDITVTSWDANGTKTTKTLKWNGHGFSF